MNGLRLYLRYARMNLRCALAYRHWMLNVGATALNTAVDFLGVMILFARFGAIGDWTAGHTLLCFGLTTTAFGLAEWFSRRFDTLPWYVRSGDLDRMLTRPRSLTVQVIGHSFEINRFGRVIVGAGCAAAAFPMLGITPNAARLLTMACAVAGGYLLYTGTFIVFAALSICPDSAIIAAAVPVACPVSHARSSVL
jgi:ABC-2 type transport system permease protein